MGFEDDLFTINILINGVRMPLNIPRKEEELYRDAEKLLNNYLNKFQGRYQQKSMEEILTIAAFQLATIIIQQEKNQDVSPLATKIQEINKEIAELLA
ncbi:MAG: cell division protein ZapA [Paludibacteraceae bacterium]